MLDQRASLFFKRRRDDCERRLTAVRVEGDWEAWTALFLEGMATVARDAVASARERPLALDGVVAVRDTHRLT